MSEEAKAALDRLLDDYDKKLQERQKMEGKKQTEEEAFAQAFKKLSSSVILPIMEKMGLHLKMRGHDYRVYEEDETVDAEGRTRDACIYINIYPAGIERSKFGSTNTPSVKFSATKSNRLVCIYMNKIMPDRGGSWGPNETFDTANITSALVERKILELLREILK